MFSKKALWTLMALLLVVSLVLTACGQDEEEAEEYVFGVFLVGPYNDHGWSEAHYSAGQYVEEKLDGAKMVWIDKVNPADRPETTVEQVVDDFVDQGAQVIFSTSDDFKDETRLAAEKHSDVFFVHISGDDVWTGKAPDNLANLMGRMEAGKAIAGCAAGMMTESKVIGYLGPLINEETRRLASSAYLGARYCYENYRGGDPDELRFIVTWIGFWFHIPGVTLDPTEVANDLFNSGADVVMSGIDTTEALVVAKQRNDQGESVWAVAYDYEDGCAEAPDVCLGVPYFNWGPGYLDYIEAAKEDKWERVFDWRGPDWKDINNRDTTAVGFVFGDGLTSEAESSVQEYIDGLASDEIQIFQGPLNYQDGSSFILGGAVGSDKDVWYMEQLLEGMEGASQ